MTPPDPQLKGAWYPGGFKPLPLNINPGFKTCLSECNPRRYTSGAPFVLDARRVLCGNARVAPALVAVLSKVPDGPQEPHAPGGQ